MINCHKNQGPILRPVMKRQAMIAYLHLCSKNIRKMLADIRCTPRVPSRARLRAHLTASGTNCLVSYGAQKEPFRPMAKGKDSFKGKDCF
mmetsp:Transcript_29876/g.88798  ORF Transcript_29876/g.88798 Transcript_29876/m.88798 type:complete len:90 (-) Transcript_29876:338-607(-)